MLYNRKPVEGRVLKHARRRYRSELDLLTLQGTVSIQKDIKRLRVLAPAVSLASLTVGMITALA